MFNWKTSQILTFGLAVIITLLVLRTNAATQRNDRGEGAVNKADPCVFLPNPPGEAKGIDKK
jgi:hypothetical protein